MNIASLHFRDRPLFLAPMEDVTNPAFRRLCKQYGADMVYTEFVSCDALVRKVPRTEQKLQVHDEERPVAIQLYGKDSVAMAEAAQRAEAAGPDLIDINFGCPVKKVAGKGAGAGLLKDVPRMLEITRAVVQAVKLPVTVKTRLGWDDSQRIIVDLAEALQDCGIAALSIHGRTRAQMYRGEADWTLIGQVKNNPRMHIPIIGNGDVSTGEQAKVCFERYGVDAVMVGRAAIGCPWVFRQLRHYLDTGEPLSDFGRKEQLEVLRQQVDDNIAWLGERRGILHIRRHLAVTPVFKGIPHFRDRRIALLRASTREELFALLDSFENT